MTVRVLSESPLSFDVVDRTVGTIDVPRPQTPSDRLGVVGVDPPDVVEELERQYRTSWNDAAMLLE